MMNETWQWVVVAVAVVLVSSIVAVHYSYEGGISGAYKDIGKAGKNFFTSIGKSWGLIDTEDGIILAPTDNQSIDELSENGVITNETANSMRNQTANATGSVINVQAVPPQNETQGIVSRIFNRLNITSANNTKVEFNTTKYTQWIANKVDESTVLAKDTYAFTTDVLLPLPTEFFTKMSEEGYMDGFFDVVEELFSESLQLIIAGVQFFVNLAVETFELLVAFTGELDAVIPALSESASRLGSMDISELNFSPETESQARDLVGKVLNPEDGLLSRILGRDATSDSGNGSGLGSTINSLSERIKNRLSAE